MKPTEVAAAWLAQSPVFLDTETTGFGMRDQIVDIAVVDQHGQVLLNTLVKPTIPIPPDAYSIHGISDRDVAHAPTFAEVYLDLAPILRAAGVCVIWNSAFDVRLLCQSLEAHNLPRTKLPGVYTCAMELYAEHWGEQRRDGAYKWQRLIDAARQCKLSWNLGAAHRSLSDADMARRIVLHLAGLAQPKPAGTEQQPALL